MPTKRKKRLGLVLNGPAQSQTDDDQVSASVNEAPPARIRVPSSAPYVSTPSTTKNSALSPLVINTQRPPTINQALAKIQKRGNGTS